MKRATRFGSTRFFILPLLGAASAFSTVSATSADLSTRQGVKPASVPAIPAAKGQFTFKATFPAQWRRQDGSGFSGAQRVNQFGQVDRVLNMFADEPTQGSLERTFEAIWDREVARCKIRLDNPGLLSPERPQPLKRRLKNGLAVWFESGVGRLGQLGTCYLQVFMIPAEKTVTVVTVIYVLPMEQTSSADRAPVWAFLESLQPGEPIPKQPLFTAPDCVGSWRMTLFGSSRYLGDVSSAGTDDLDLKLDGTYSRLVTTKLNGIQSSRRESGSWTVDDNLLALTPKSTSDEPSARPQKHLLYARAVSNGKVNLIVGTSDEQRLPTDMREAGAMVEVATRGGALLRYEAR